MILSINVTPEVEEKISERAKQIGLSKSKYVSLIIDQYLRSNRKLVIKEK